MLAQLSGRLRRDKKLKCAALKEAFVALRGVFAIRALLRVFFYGAQRGIWKVAHMQNTIVTACDRNYIWGAYILTASLRFHGGTDKIHVLAEDFRDEDRALLEQFDNVTVFDEKHSTGRGVNTQKPEAIKTATTELITWMDADCMAVGNVEPLLRYCPDRFQIRARGPEENSEVYRRQYRQGDGEGGVPLHILAQWQEDVAQREEPAQNTTVITNCFVLNRSHLPFIDFWEQQMKRVLRPGGGVVDARNLAYQMTDESTLSSLFAFFSDAPDIGEFQLDKDPANHLAHFSLQPKPWVGWRKPMLTYFDPLMEIIKWARESGYKTPEIPFSLQAHYKPFSVLSANLRNVRANTRSATSRLIRRVKRGSAN